MSSLIKTRKTKLRHYNVEIKPEVSYIQETLSIGGRSFFKDVEKQEWKIFCLDCI